MQGLKIKGFHANATGKVFTVDQPQEIDKFSINKECPECGYYGGAHTSNCAQVN